MKNNPKNIRVITIHAVLICCFFLLAPSLSDAGSEVDRGGHEARSRRSGPIIIDHTCTDISRIPAQWIESAKQLTLHYAHTSHGGQICSGVKNLESLDSTYGFARRVSGSEGLPPQEDPPVLRMYDGNPPEHLHHPRTLLEFRGGKRQHPVRCRYRELRFFHVVLVRDRCRPAHHRPTFKVTWTMNQFETEYPAMGFILYDRTPGRKRLIGESASTQ